MPSPRIEAAAADSEQIREALRVAREAHAGQTRNGSGGMDYIHHPIAVAEQLSQSGFDGDTLAAALLHDVVEDSETTVADIRRQFGDEVARLVEALSDEEEIEPYTRRKDVHRERVEAAGREAMAIYGADKLSNVATLRRAYAEEGERVGEEFAPSLDTKEGVWRADLEMLRRSYPGLPFLDQFEEQLDALSRSRNRAGLAPDRR